MLVHLVELAPLGGEPGPSYEAVAGELSSYGARLDRLPELVVLSKRDLLAADRVESAVGEWKARLGGRALGVLAVSSATGEGLDELRQRILDRAARDPGSA